MTVAAVDRGSRDHSQDTVRTIEVEEMTLFAEGTENLSIAHSSSPVLPRLSGFPGGDFVLGCSVHHDSGCRNRLLLTPCPFRGRVC